MDQEVEGRKKFYLSLLVLLCCSGVASAQGWYAGAGIGQSRADNLGACSSSNGLSPGFSCSGSGSSTGWRLFAGYEINRNLAVEGGYLDLGEFHGSAENAPSLNPDSATSTAHPSGFTLDTTVSLTPCCGVPKPPSTSVNANGVSVDFGVGVKYDFDKNLGVRAEFQRFANIGNDVTGKSDVSLISASL